MIGPTGPRGAQSLYFDGSDDLVTITKSNYFLAGNGLTFEAWIRPQTLSSNPLYAAVVKTSGHALTLSSTTGGFDQTSYAMLISTPTTNNARAPLNTLQTGVWQHVAGTYDGSEIRLYLDGSPIAVTSHPGIADGFTTVMLGRWDASFHGAIDEVRIWDHARSESEILGAMNQVLTGSEAGLLAYYRFEGSGQTVVDSSAGGAHGVLGADVSVEASDPVRQAN